MHPKYLIYAAVARQTVKGTPPDGWFPEQRISVEEAIEAYTINNARACFEDGIRGSLETGQAGRYHGLRPGPDHHFSPGNPGNRGGGHDHRRESRF